MSQMIATILCLIWFCAAMAQPLVFRGEECLTDCARHRTGYEWAKSARINNPAECRGPSESFIEGCKIYTKEITRSRSASL